MTKAEELRFDPDYDRIDQRLIADRVVEWPYPHRTPTHSTTLSSISFQVGAWAGDVPGKPWAAWGFACPYRLCRDPDTLLAYGFSLTTRTLRNATPRDALFIEGVPTLVVEVIDRTDEPESTYQLVTVSLDCGVPLVWTIDPFKETMQVHRRGRPVIVLQPSDDLTGEEVLPGFHCRVANIFR